MWPPSLAPYQVHLVALPGKGDAAAEVVAAADRLYDELGAAGVDGALRRPRREPGREVRRRRPPRHADARHRRGEGTRPWRSSSCATAAPASRPKFPSPMPPPRWRSGPHLIRPATQPAPNLPPNGRSHMGRFVLGNGPWMTWNVALALLPLLAAVVLFGRDAAHRSMLWWAGLVGLVLFLPNAPYVLTDVVHLPESLRGVRPGRRRRGRRVVHLRLAVHGRRRVVRALVAPPRRLLRPAPAGRGARR